MCREAEEAAAPAPEKLPAAPAPAPKALIDFKLGDDSDDDDAVEEDYSSSGSE